MNQMDDRMVSELVWLDETLERMRHAPAVVCNLTESACRLVQEANAVLAESRLRELPARVREYLAQSTRCEKMLSRLAADIRDVRRQVQCRQREVPQSALLVAAPFRG